MKNILRLALLFFPILSSLDAQTPENDSATSFQVAANLDIDPSIIRFVPPPPPKPAPPLDVKSATVRQHQGRTMTVIRAEASTLPDVPELPAFDQKARQGTPDHSRNTYLLPLSVVIYNRKISHVTWTDQRSEEKFEAWCDWNWSLLSPIQAIKGIDEDYTLIFTPGHVDTLGKPPLFNPVKMPSHPPIPTGGHILTVGDPKNPGGRILSALQHFKDRNKVKLEALLEAREKYQSDASLWRAANPSKPENNTIWFKPHRGSRYLSKTGSATVPETQTKEEAR